MMATGRTTEFANGAGLDSGAIERLKSDTHLLILSVFSVIASMAIAPFAVYRLLESDFFAASIDGLVLATILGNLVFAWKTGRVGLAGNIMATLLAAAALVAIFVAGLSYLWLFSLMIAIFLLASSNRLSIVFSFLLIGAAGSVPDLFADPVERFTFIAVAAQVALFSFVFAWRTSRQHRLLDMLASRDPLTGAGNRRALRREIHARADAARQVGECAALALIDLDHFKQVNDRHGHDAGDKVLIDLADIVRGTMRACDTFYRYGGEEFVLVMPGTLPEGIAPALEKLLEVIRARLRAPDGVAVTVSLGAAVLCTPEDQLSWLSRADRALYAAKSAGRNRLCIDSE